MSPRAGVGRVAALALVVALVAGPVAGLAGGCFEAGTEGGETTLTVYAAASLAPTFERIGEELESGREDVEVEVAAGGSSDLVAQILAGAPADVFASADTATMDRLADEGLADGEPAVFATNTLQIAVPSGNPKGVTSLADLAAAGVDVVVCAPQVPCGAAAARAQELAGVDLEPVSEEQSVTDVLAKVTAGEADAGLVYVTDVLAAGDAVTGVAFPESAEVVNRYPIVAVAGAEHGALAEEFVALVLGETGQALLREAGFAQP